MIQSLVDYVLQRGKIDYGQFAPRDRESIDPATALYNHRKLLAYLFQEDQNSQQSPESKLQKRISDIKLQQLAGQLNYYSQKIHGQLSKKQLTLNSDLYRLQNEWLRKKMPDFYCYYFLKFAYANSYSRMHQLFLSQIENMSKEKDSYLVIKKTIEARQSCLHNLRKLIQATKDIDVEQSLQTLREENQMKRQLKIAKEHGNYKQKQFKIKQETGKSWKNALQVLFENIIHLRKLTCYVVQLIKIWRSSIYNMSDDPRRFRERVIFYHNDTNYLLKMLFDSNFIRQSFLKNYLKFSSHFDPFLLKPSMILDNKKNKTETQEIFLDLVKPSQLDLDKITKALVIMAEEEYDQDQQSRFINQRKNFGELQQRKQFIERRRDTLGIRKYQSQKNFLQKPLTSKGSKDQLKTKQLQFKNDKKSANTQKQLEQIKSQKQDSKNKMRIQTSRNRLKQMRLVDLKKISPYLSRNQRIQKVQKVIQLQHKFRVAQSEYVKTLQKNKQQQMRQKIKSTIDINKQTMNSKIFNRYIEQNLKMMDQASKRAFLFKNHIPAQERRMNSSINYNKKISFHDRKQIEYQRNLNKYYPKEQTSQTSPKPTLKKEISKPAGTKAIIQISNRGVRTNQKIIQYQLSGKKGKNIGDILQKRDKSLQRSATKNLFQGMKGQSSINQQKNNGQVNLFQTEKQNQILIIRQEPQKLQEIKQFLYVKIKQQLMEEMKKNAQNKQFQLNNMIEEEKRKRLQQIIQQRKREEERKRQQQERERLLRLQRQRKKLNFDVRIEPIQYAQENTQEFFNTVFGIQHQTFNRLFTTQKIDTLKQDISKQFYYIFIKGYYEDKQSAFCIAHFSWQYELHRKIVIDYLVTKDPYYYISTLHRIIQYIWKNDPCQQIQMVMFKNEQNIEGSKVMDDVDTYIQQSGQVFQKQLYSNIQQFKYVWMRSSNFNNIQFPYQNYYFGKLLNFKSELLSSSISLSERHAPKIDMTLQVFTNYIFLLQELFRSYLTPQEVVQLRQNSTNIRRLKDIFRIVLQLQKNNPLVDQLTVVQGLNLDDLYAKVKDKKMAPYDRYYWHHFYDKIHQNRLLLAILQIKSQLKFNMQTCMLMDRKFLRINCRQKILILRSSIYAEQNIYILDTQNPKIKIFLTEGQHYKLMRMQLFIFLNLIFNNIVEDQQKFINCIWIPQFAICDSSQGKEVKRITDFSISMKKSFFISQQIYYCNHEYIKSAVSLLPKQSDVIFRQSFIFGYMHTEIEKASTGMPLYAKLIDKKQMFN